MDLDKLHHYRELKRNREIKDTNLFNKMCVKDRQNRNLILDTSDPKQLTGLDWYVPLSLTIQG